LSSNDSISWSNIDPKNRKLIMAGLMLGMLAACLDGTIVATSGTNIAAHLGGLGLFSWMFTAYLLCETIAIPIAGKLSDLYGRKPFFLVGLSLFLAGSVGAGFSTSMEMLIVFRAIQGLGAGILMPVATAAIADLYSPIERGKMQGIMGAIFGLGTAAGPVLGGIITDYISWNWVFFINVPIVVLSLSLIARQFPSVETVNKKRIDFLGMSVLGLFLLDLLLFFTWAGSEFDWVSLDSGLMVLAAAGLLGTFIFLEKRADDPVIAPRLFKNKMFVCGAFAMLIFGLGMTGAMAYMSMFSIYIFGLSSKEAGYLLIAMVAGLIITATLSGKFVQRTGYKPWVIAGPIISCAAMGMMSTLGLGDSVWLFVAYIFLLGVGLGCVMAVIMVAVQNSAKGDEMGMTTSGVNLFRAIGSTVATAVFASLINLRIDNELKSSLAAEVYSVVPHDTNILAYLTVMPQYSTQILTAFADSVDFAFLIGGAILLLMVFVAPFMKGYVMNAEEPQVQATKEPKDV
jgi:EmrB/QacA subfamily drug resistance transporter